MRIGSRVVAGFGVQVALIAAMAVMCLFFIAQLHGSTVSIHAGRMAALAQLPERETSAPGAGGSAGAASTDGARASTTIAEQEQAAVAEFDAAVRTYRMVRGLILVGAPVMVLFCLWVAFGVARNLSSGVALIVARLHALRERQIPVLRAGAAAMAQGDLSTALEVQPLQLAIDRPDEIGELADALNAVDHEIGAMALALERSRATLQGLLHESTALVAAARRGELSHRVRTREYDGAYRDLAVGLNDTLVAVAAPLQAATAVLQRVAERDLTARVTRDDPGEFRTLRDSLNATVMQLAAALQEVESAVVQVSSATDEIAAGSHALAEGSSTQAAALAEASRGARALSDRTHANAEHAQQARLATDEGRARTREGVASMEELSAAMTDVRAAAESTARILKVIEEIAFQTNLLALNAAVEAARAGEAGAGFAVVASEVRALSQRSAASAREVASQVDRLMATSARGVTLNAQVRARLTEIDEQVQRVGGAITAIAAAAADQTRGFTELDEAIARVNEVTQASAAHAQESAASTLELSSQAAAMRDLVRQFTLPDRPVAGGGAMRRRRPDMNDPAHDARPAHDEAAFSSR